MTAIIKALHFLPSAFCAGCAIHFLADNNLLGASACATSAAYIVLAAIDAVTRPRP